MSGATEHGRAPASPMPREGAGRAGSPRAATFGLVLWVGAVGAALWAQQLLTAAGSLAPAAVVFYTLAGILAVVAMALIERQAPLAERPRVAPPSPRWNWRRHGSATLLLFAALAASGTCIHLLEIRQRQNAAFWLWVASLGLALVATMIGGRSSLEKGRIVAGTQRADDNTRQQRARWAQLHRPQVIEVALVLAILALALALRAPRLIEIPPEVHGDEAECGIDARRVLHGDVPSIFGFGWYGVPYMSFGISAAFMRVFGDDLYGLRMASVIQGTLSVLLAYLIVKRLFGVRVAALSAFLLAIAHWHIHFSRSGIHYMQSLVATLLFFLFFLRGLDRQRVVDFLLAGFAAGLCFEVYFAARLAPVLAAAYLLHKLASERHFLRRYGAGLLSLAFGAVLFLAPMRVAYARAPQMLLYRTHGVFIFSRGNERHALESYHVGSMKEVLRIQAVNSLLVFNRGPESSVQYGHRGPLIDRWSGALFVLGGVVATLRIRRPRYFFVAAWFWLTLLFGSVLTIDAPFSPRVIIMAPVLFVFSALVLDAGWRASGAVLGRWGTAAFALLVAAWLLLATQANYADYFHLYVKEMQPAGFNTILANFVKSINDRYRVYLLAGNDNWFGFSVERFLLPQVDAVNVGNQPLPLPLDRVPAEKGVAFVVRSGLPDAALRLASIEAAYPGGRTELHQTTSGSPVFTSYLVEHDRLVAAKPDAKVDHARIPGLPLYQVRQLPPTRAAEP